ncbi:heat shock protein Pss1 [Orobanche hederae]
MELNGHRRGSRKDLVVYQNGELSTSSGEEDHDPWTAWAYKPRTITLLLVGACFLVWASGALDPERSSETDFVTTVKRGIWAMIAVFLAYCLLQAPSTLLTRPHPAIWRLVHGMAVIYLVTLTFLLFQKRDDARQIMGFLHPDLGVELPERSYGADCRIYMPENPTSRFKNVYCIWAGMRTVRYFDGKTYEWVGISRQPNIMGKVKRTLGQFTPARWDKDEWHPLLGPLRFIQVLSLCIVFLTVELNTFFLKFCLWIPPRNPLIVYRLVLWWLIAIPTIREYNSYLQDRKPVKKVGAFCWISLAICIVELLICIKFGHGLFPNAMPRWLVVLWTCVGTGIVMFLGAWSWQLHRLLKRKRQ